MVISTLTLKENFAYKTCATDIGRLIVWLPFMKDSSSLEDSKDMALKLVYTIARKIEINLASMSITSVT